MFTKGPWKQGAIMDCVKESTGEKPRIVAVVCSSYFTHEQVEANSRLIQKAPELFLLAKDFHFILTSKLELLNNSIKRTKETKVQFEEVEGMIKAVEKVTEFVEKGDKEK